MSNVHNFADRVRPKPVEVLNADDLQGRPVPPRRWVVANFVPRRNVALFTGDGGLGKTLLMLQVQVAMALGHSNVLGLSLPGKPTTTFGFYCEDDRDELHARLDALCRHYGVGFRDLDGRVMYMSRANEVDNGLMRFNSRNFEGSLSGLYHQVADIIRQNGVELTILDNIGNVFMGQHNEKSHVVPFVGALRGLASINDGGVILCGHPSMSGKASGSGMAGSTAWETAVRCRIYLTKPKTDKDGDGDERPTDDRILRVMKSNYGPSGGKLRITWKNHVFVPTDSLQAPAYYVDRD